MKYLRRILRDRLTRKAKAKQPKPLAMTEPLNPTGVRVLGIGMGAITHGPREK